MTKTGKINGWGIKVLQIKGGWIKAGIKGDIKAGIKGEEIKV